MYIYTHQTFVGSSFISDSWNKSLKKRNISSCRVCLGNSPVQNASPIVPVSVVHLPVHCTGMVTGSLHEKEVRIGYITEVPQKALG